MNVFVTGGAGYIGSHVVRLLLEAGHRVRVYDNLAEGHAAAIPEETLVRGDLMDAQRLVEAMDEGFDCVMHFAAHCYVGESMINPEKYYATNVVAGLRLLTAMRRAGVRRIVFSSSAATYGEPEQIPITEEHPQNPINAYGQTKLDFEHALGFYAGAYGLGYASLRYFNAAGAAPDGAIGEDHDPETHLVPIVLQAALGQRESVQIFGTDYPTRDGTCVRDYIHVCDLAQAHILAMERIEPGKGGWYNLGNGNGYTVREVIDVARKTTGRKIPAEAGPRRPGDPPELVASSEKIARELGWKPQYPDLETIIETAWRWHEAHPNGYGD
ncbi:MAG TPA: UDP-glucose 4-epimerase GalE [Phycisphaerae bacterium]|nr:UDP-glucose 4-epimerase GalE [Phycisphaerae bacterium]